MTEIRVPDTLTVAGSIGEVSHTHSPPQPPTLGPLGGSHDAGKCRKPKKSWFFHVFFSLENCGAGPTENRPDLENDSWDGHSETFSGVSGPILMSWNTWNGLTGVVVVVVALLVNPDT